ncbi:MAG: pseudouridine synthase, partial [Bacteroidetes bacterium]|nr:pseudouridine synthase [Bacteroidota bacterium]
SLVAGACKERIFPVGRLDRNTTGLLLFTNDGELAKKLLHPKYNVRKVYHVELDKNITKADMEKISAGLELEDGVAEVDEIVWSSDAKNAVGLEIHIGKNRVVRRIFESLGYHVVKLDRVIFAGLTKKNLPRAKWRFLSEKEVNHLKMNNFS